MAASLESPKRKTFQNKKQKGKIKSTVATA